MKKLINVICIAFVLASTINLTTGAATNFSDVDSKYWAYNYIQELTSNNIINGYPDQTFKPKETLTYNEFIKLIIKTLKIDNIRERLENEHWSAPFLDKAKEINIIDKDIDAEDKDKPIEREEMADIIAKALGYKIEYITLDEDIEKQFDDNIRDKELINEQYIESVKKVYQYGIINGYPDGTFKPKDYLTRAETTKVIVKLMETLENPKKIELVKEKQEEIKTPVEEKVEETKPIEETTKGITVNKEGFKIAPIEYILQDQELREKEIINLDDMKIHEDGTITISSVEGSQRLSKKQSETVIKVIENSVYNLPEGLKIMLRFVDCSYEKTRENTFVQVAFRRSMYSYFFTLTYRFGTKEWEETTVKGFEKNPDFKIALEMLHWNLKNKEDEVVLKGIWNDGTPFDLEVERPYLNVYKCFINGVFGEDAKAIYTHTMDIYCDYSKHDKYFKNQTLGETKYIND